MNATLTLPAAEGVSFDCGNGLHAPVCSGCGCSCHSTGWHRFAACHGADPDLFHAPDSDIPESGQAREARETAALAVCARCPVTGACLSTVLRLPGSRDHGVAGGTTDTQRRSARHRLAARRLRDRRKAAAA